MLYMSFYPLEYNFIYILPVSCLFGILLYRKDIILWQGYAHGYSIKDTAGRLYPGITLYLKCYQFFSGVMSTMLLLVVLVGGKI